MDIRKISPHLLKVSKEDLSSTTSKIGEVVYSFLQKEHPSITVEEILDQYQHKYVQELESTIQNNIHKYDSPFHIVVLSKKEPWAPNVLRNWFIARQTRPTVSYLRREYPNYMNTVYCVDARDSTIKILWSLPTKQDSETILKNKHLYDSQLVKWIEDCNSDLLDRAA